MAININKKEGDKLHAEEWNELAQEVMGKQPRLNIVDDLNSDSSVDVLSAKQGKVLDEKINSATSTIEGISEKVDKLPTGYYYGQFDSVSGLPDVNQSTQKGYAYVASEDPSIYYIYLFEGEGSSWEDSGNKFVTTVLEDDLSTKSETKAPTTKVVAEGIEDIDLISNVKTGSKELDTTQKYNANANISNRIADVEVETGVVKALGYKVLNPNLSFAEQVTRANTVYEIKDKFDLGGSWQSIECDTAFSRVINESVEKIKLYLCGIITTVSSISLTTGQKIIFEKGFFLLEKLDNDDNYSILAGPSEEEYTASEDITVYIAQYGFGASCRYSTDDGVTFTGIKAINNKYAYIASSYYGATVQFLKNETIYLRGNQYLFNSNNKLLQQGGTYTFNSQQEVKIAMTYEGTTSYFKANKINIPQNVELYFNGGKLFNGIIESNNVKITTSRRCFDNVFLSKTSTIYNNEIRLSWFIDENQEASEVITSILDTCCRTLLNDVYTLYVYKPIVARAYSKTILGVVTAGGLASVSVQSARPSRLIVDDDNWDARGYYENAILIADHSIEIKDIQFYGSKKTVIYNTNFPLKVDYGIYIHAPFSNAISNCLINYCAISAIRLCAVERGTITNCSAYYNGAFIIAIPYKLNKANPFQLNIGAGEGGNPISMLRVSNNYTVFNNYGILVVPGSDVHIEKNCISYTSLSAIYVLNTYLTVNIKENYFEGCGSSAFWLDENGWSGDAISHFSSMCAKIAQPHRSEYGTYASAGWGMGCYTGNDKYIRAVITLLSESPTLHGKVSIQDNEFSFNFLRSSLNSGINFNNTTIGVDAAIFISTEATVIGACGMTTAKERAPYWLVVSGGNYSIPTSPMDLVVTDLPPVFKDKNTWFYTRGANSSLPINVNGLPTSLVNPNCKEIFTNVRSAFYAYVSTTALGNINEICSFYKELDGKKYYSFPSYTYGTSTVKGVGFKLPWTIFNNGPRIVEITILNESNTDVSTINGSLCYFTSSSSKAMLPTSVFYFKYAKVSKGSKNTYYFFLSPDLFFGIDNITDIQLEISTGNYDDIYFSIPTMRFVGEGNVNDLSFEGLDEYGYLKYGNSEDRPTVSSNIAKPISYYDMTLNKKIYWNGSYWADAMGKPTELQVSDTSILIGAAADSTKDVSVYYGGTTAPTISILNSDDTPCTWLTGTPDPFTGNTLTLTATTANTDSNPRGCKVVVTLGNEEKIINVVQNYLTT
jgi:hypothetical protein